MAKAWDTVAAALRAELLAGRLSGRLPGMRELARRQGVSTFIVFQALARLEAAGMVERRSRSGVNALTAAPLRVVIAKHQPWQLRFWHAIVAKAPGPIELVFQAHRASLAQLLSDGASAALRDLQTVLAEIIAVPLLAGDLSAAAAHARLGRLIGQLSARADDRHRTQLRRLLLSET